LPTPGTGPSVDPTALTLIAAAVRSRMRIAQRDAACFWCDVIGT
jgi:hypothetical protein